MQRYQSNATFKCPSCGVRVVTSVGIPEPTLNRRPPDNLLSAGWTSVRCPNCGWMFGAYAKSTPLGTEIKLNRDANIRIDAAPAAFGEYEGEAGYVVPEN